MGGNGSGRDRDRGARRIGAMKSIELSWLRRRKLLRPITSTVITWSVDGEAAGSVNCTVFEHGINLQYRTQSHIGNWYLVDETIAFDYTPTNFRGKRTWFACPSCERRCSALYGGELFRCRQCYGLTYESQYEAPSERSLSKANKIIKQLGGHPSDAEFPEKPKNMHWQTYERLYLRYLALEQSSLHGLMGRLG